MTRYMELYERYLSCTKSNPCRVTQHFGGTVITTTADYICDAHRKETE